MAKNIGSLNIAITASAAQLAAEFKRADNVVARSTKSWQGTLKKGLELGAGMVGAQAGFAAISSEIRNVIQNVERIPGIPSGVVTSIATARAEFKSFRDTIDGGIARVIAFGVEAARAVGAGAAMLMGADGDDVQNALSKLPTPDEQARADNANYDAQLEAARKRLIELQKQSALATMDEAGQIKALREEAERYDRYAESKSITTLEAINARTEAREREAAAAGKMRKLEDDLKAAERKLGESSFGAARASLTPEKQLEGLKERQMGLQIDMADINQRIKNDPNDPAAIQLKIDKTKELTATNQALEKVIEKQKESWREVGETIAGSFEDAVFSGASLKDMLKGLEQDLLRIMFRRMVTAPLANFLMGGLSKTFGGFFADGGDFGGGKPIVVGERGPELIVPRGPGTVVPNHELKGRGASRVAGAVFHFVNNIAAGVSRAELIPALEANRRATMAEIRDLQRRGAYGF